MATFILIHGAWHGSWCWERVVPLLSKMGHRVLAPDLPGMGEDSTPLDKITLDIWAKFVANLVSKQKEKVILVGHSRGGIVISQAAEYAPQNIGGLIYLSAFLIQSGGTLLDTLHQHPRDPERPADLIISSDNNTSTITAAAIRNTFYNTTSENWIHRAAAQMGPEPMTSFITPLALTDANFDQVPRAYIECLQDNAIPIELQRKMVSVLPCQQVTTLDTDHSPFYSAPELLAAQLADLARGFDCSKPKVK